MTDVRRLRALGREGLASLLATRPELLRPHPPASLEELAARLEHPVPALTALRRLDLAVLQVAQVLAALGERADRPRLLRLLDAGDGEGSAAVERCLATLRANLLLLEEGSDDGGGDGGVRLVPTLRALWLQPLGLAPTVTELAATCTVEDLRAVLGRLGEAPAGRKADLVARVGALLDDGPRVRRLVEDLPGPFVRQLLQVAHGVAEMDPYGWGHQPWNSPLGRFHRGADDPLHRPVDWAVARFLLVRPHGGYDLVMPAEVALALRGDGWHAVFAPHPPPVAWAPRPAVAVADAALAAASAALRTTGEVLASAGRRPVPRLKSGAVGVRELRRLAGEAGATTGEARLALALAARLDLLDADADPMAPTAGFDAWVARPAAVRHAELAAAWRDLASVPLLQPDAAWQPGDEVPSAPQARRAVLAALARRPGDAAPGADVVELVRWAAPMLLGTAVRSGPAGPDDPPDVLGDVVHALLAEAAWLGLTGTGALSPAGSALHADGDVAAALGEGLGTVQRRARLQGDLTAVVLGEPAADLAAELDLLADRENRSAASVWRFSPASVRRALDAGGSADGVLDRLAGLAESGVPQPLEYLVRDVARRHGAVRARGVACYLRCDDEGLLAELVADRRLRDLGLRRVAPAVAVGARPLAQTLAALRAAGHAPVEEDADGGVVVDRPARHRAGARPPAPTARRPREDKAGADPLAAAEALLAAPDRAGTLVDVGGTVIDLRAAGRAGHRRR